MPIADKNNVICFLILIMFTEQKEKTILKGKRVFPVCYSDKHFVNSALITNILFENRERKVLEVLDHLPVLKF